jgi:hypothetical protein
MPAASRRRAAARVESRRAISCIAPPNLEAERLASVRERTH